MNDGRDSRARLAVILQRIAPDLAAPLWRVKTLRDLPVTWREDVADNRVPVSGCPLSDSIRGPGSAAGHVVARRA
jgi:hypothetical protein